MDTFIRITIIGIASFSLVALSFLTKSSFIEESFVGNAFILAIAVFAIHASTSAILLSQLNILNRQFKINFLPTISSIKNSFIEDAGIIFGILLVSIAHASDSYGEYAPQVKGVLSVFLLSLLASQLWIIYDTLIAILQAFKFEAQRDE